MRTPKRRADSGGRLSSAVLLVVALALLGGVAGAAFGFLQGSSSTAQSAVLLAPLEGNAFSPVGRGDDLINMQTEAQLVTSDVVARAVAEELGLDAVPQELTSKLEVTSPVNTQILRIRYTASNEDDAVARAQAFADSFLEFRRSRAQTLIDDRTESLDEQIEEQSDQLNDLVRQRAQATSDTVRAVLDEEIDVTTAQLSQLRTQRAAYRSTSTDPGQVVTPARAQAGGPPAVLLYGLAGALFGGLVGLVIALFRTRTPTRPLLPVDLEPMGLPLLGRISRPQASRVRAAVGDEARMVEAVDRDYKEIRSALTARIRERPATLLMAGSSEIMEAPLSPLGLGHALALSHLETILVDASGKPGGISVELDVARRSGLCEVLMGQTEAQRALVPVADRLRVLPLGRDLTHFDDLASSPRMDGVLALLRSQADVVLVVTGPLTSVTNRFQVTHVDAVVLEAVEGQVQVRDVAELLEDEAVGRAVVGLVFVARGRRGGSPDAPVAG